MTRRAGEQPAPYQWFVPWIVILADFEVVQGMNLPGRESCGTRRREKRDVSALMRGHRRGPQLRGKAVGIKPSAPSGSWVAGRYVVGLVIEKKTGGPTLGGGSPRPLVTHAGQTIVDFAPTGLTE